jgi:hypothetical protein
MSRDRVVVVVLVVVVPGVPVVLEVVVENGSYHNDPSRGRIPNCSRNSLHGSVVVVVVVVVVGNVVVDVEVVDVDVVVVVVVFMISQYHIQ